MRSCHCTADADQLPRGNYPHMHTRIRALELQMTSFILNNSIKTPTILLVTRMHSSFEDGSPFLQGGLQGILAALGTGFGLKGDIA